MSGINNSLIGIISDTHDQVSNLIKAIEYFNLRKVESVIHCGDWVSSFTLVYYSKLKAPIYGVFGNNDGDKFRHLKYVKELGLEIHIEDKLFITSFHDKKVVAYHGDSLEIVNALIKCREYDVVFYGHTHQAKIELCNGILSLNPGSLVDLADEKKQSASIGLYDSQKHEGQIIWLSDL
jgi:uncharacterized protein